MSGKLIITRGYPGSGKTTWAKNYEGAVRVNRDDLRESVFNEQGVLEYKKEQLISDIQRNMASALLDKGHTVIVDDTNLRLKYAKLWADFAILHDAEFVVVDFNIPVEECISNVQWRADMGGRCIDASVIEKFASRYPYPFPPIEQGEETVVKAVKVKKNTSLPATYIFDIDGTLSHGDHRGPYDLHLVQGDTVDASVAHILEALQWDHDIIIVSGREATCREQTINWLDDNNIAYDALFMRQLGDSRPDTVVKLEIFDKHIRDNYNVIGVFDDRNSVVNMWRSIGLKCFQVQPGAF